MAVRDLHALRHIDPGILRRRAVGKTGQRQGARDHPRHREYDGARPVTHNPRPRTAGQHGDRDQPRAEHRAEQQNQREPGVVQVGELQRGVPDDRDHPGSAERDQVGGSELGEIVLRRGGDRGNTHARSMAGSLERT